ncbi:hypothetical protein MRX96_031474 [Rhipicephalus microplus]
MLSLGVLAGRLAYDCAGRASTDVICISHQREPPPSSFQVAGQDISPEEMTTESGWLTAQSCRSPRDTDNSTPTDESSQAPTKLSTKTPVSPPSTPKQDPVPSTKTKKDYPCSRTPSRSRPQRSRSRSASGTGRKSTNNTQPSCARLRPFWDADGDITHFLPWPTLTKALSFGSETAEDFTTNDCSSINTYVNIATALMLFYSKKRKTPLPHSSVIKHSTELMHVAGHGVASSLFNMITIALTSNTCSSK